MTCVSVSPLTCFPLFNLIVGEVILAYSLLALVFTPEVLLNSCRARPSNPRIEVAVCVEVLNDLSNLKLPHPKTAGDDARETLRNDDDAGAVATILLTAGKSDISQQSAAKGLRSSTYIASALPSIHPIVRRTQDFLMEEIDAGTM